MLCPKCKQEARKSMTDAQYGVCDNCKIKFLWQEDETVKVTPAQAPVVNESIPVQTNDEPEHTKIITDNDGFCPSCGAAIPKGSLFCVMCGTKVSNAPVDNAPETPNPAQNIPVNPAPAQNIPAAPVQPAYNNAQMSNQPAPKKKSGSKAKIIIPIVAGSVTLIIIAVVAAIFLLGGNGYKDLGKKYMEEVYKAAVTGNPSGLDSVFSSSLFKLAESVTGEDVDDLREDLYDELMREFDNYDLSDYNIDFKITDYEILDSYKIDKDDYLKELGNMFFGSALRKSDVADLGQLYYVKCRVKMRLRIPELDVDEEDSVKIKYIAVKEGLGWKILLMDF